MKLIDFVLTLLLPTLILFHLLVTPYTKVEESFNIQATHDILKYGAPLQNIGTSLRSVYDHFSFPGAVPRTFIGPVLLAGISRPIISIIGWKHAQFTVRAVLGLFNAWALHRYKKGIENAFGKDIGRWFVLLMAGQFHVIFYASRTLPNMFAFGFCTLALREVLPMSPDPKSGGEKRYRLAIYFLVLAGVIFRSELAILLSTQIGFLLLQGRISLKQVIKSGITSAAIALVVSVPVDSYFWQRPIWPELAGFYYNAIQGKSADWGTSPFHYYFTSSLPRLLLNPLIPTILIPLSIYLPSYRQTALNLIIPPLAFIAIYSLQPHKEARFIIYVVPPLTCAASLAASYIYTRRSKIIFYRILSLLLITSLFVSFSISTSMLLISSFNYPGGAALTRLHTLVEQNTSSLSSHHPAEINVHMDVLSCMTGVTHFLEDTQSPAASTDIEAAANRPVQWHHSKVEDPDTLLTPTFWSQFDYVLAEGPEKTIGKWDIVDTIYGFAGLQILRPSDPIRDIGNALAVFEKAVTSNIDISANMEYLEESGVINSQDGEEATAEEKADEDELRDKNSSVRGKELSRRILKSCDWRCGYKLSSSGLNALYELLREYLRSEVTRGWWIGPKFEGKVRILKRVED